MLPFKRVTSLVQSAPAALAGRCFCPTTPIINLVTCVRSLHVTSNLARKPGIQFAYPLSRQWAVKRRVDPEQYTVEALPKIRTGGRGPDGQIKLKHQTTGLNRPWFMVDYNHSRHVTSGAILEEIVLEIKQNWWRTHHIALVASGEVKRWIVATMNMQVGDIICSHVDVPLIPVVPRDGNAHPVGALPVGTAVCLIELHPGEGAVRCRAAGTGATVMRRGKYVADPISPGSNATKLGAADGAQGSSSQPPSLVDTEDEHVVVLRDNGTRKLLRLHPNCMVRVGQVSNAEHNLQKYSKFGEKYWHGIKQRSGLWQRKTGRFGRKIRPLGPPTDFVTPQAPDGEMVLKYTIPEDPEFTRSTQRQLHLEMKPIGKKLRPLQPEPRPHNALPDTLHRFCWSDWARVR